MRIGRWAIVPTGLFPGRPGIGVLNYVVWEMRAMRIEMKTTFASLLALGVCVWVAEARADGDEISADNSVETTALLSLNGGDLTLIGMHAHSTQNGTIEGNQIYNQDGKIETGTAINNNFGSHGIVMQAANTGINSLIQQTTTINVLLGPQN